MERCRVGLKCHAKRHLKRHLRRGDLECISTLGAALCWWTASFRVSKDHAFSDLKRSGEGIPRSQIPVSAIRDLGQGFPVRMAPLYRSANPGQERETRDPDTSFDSPKSLDAIDNLWHGGCSTWLTFKQSGLLSHFHIYVISVPGAAQWSPVVEPINNILNTWLQVSFQVLFQVPYQQISTKIHTVSTQTVIIGGYLLNIKSARSGSFLALKIHHRACASGIMSKFGCASEIKFKRPGLSSAVLTQGTRCRRARIPCELSFWSRLLPSS